MISAQVLGFTADFRIGDNSETGTCEATRLVGRSKVVGMLFFCFSHIAFRDLGVLSPLLNLCLSVS